MGNRLKRAWMALMGPDESRRGEDASSPDETAAELARRRLDVKAKEEEIRGLRDEYARREQSARAETEAARKEVLDAFIKKLAPTLSQLATLRHMAAGGREVRPQDVLKLTAKLEDALRAQGLEPVGEVGAEAAFDPALHQRMSGGDVRDGTRVRVRFPGYRFRGKTPLKAMVSRVDANGDQEGKE